MQNLQKTKIRLGNKINSILSIDSMRKNAEAYYDAPSYAIALLFTFTLLNMLSEISHK